MEKVERAAIYKFRKKNFFLIHGVSNLQMGIGTAAEPFIWIEESVPLSTITEKLVFALSQTKYGLPNPISWDESEKEFLEKAGLKTRRDLYSNSIHVSVFKKDGVLCFTPMRNQGSKGFVNISKERITVLATESLEIISLSLQEALDKCE